MSAEAVERRLKAAMRRAEGEFNAKLSKLRDDVKEAQAARAVAERALKRERDRVAGLEQQLESATMRLASAAQGAKQANASADATCLSSPSAGQHVALEARAAQEDLTYKEHELQSNVFSGEDGSNPGVAMCFFTRETAGKPDHNGDRRFSFRHDPTQRWFTKGSDVLWSCLNSLSYTIPEADLQPRNYDEAWQVKNRLIDADNRTLEQLKDRFRAHFAMELHLLQILRTSPVKLAGGKEFRVPAVDAPGRQKTLVLHGSTMYLMVAVPAWSGLVVNTFLDDRQREGIRLSSPHGSGSPDAENASRRIGELQKARPQGGHPPLTTVVTYLVRNLRGNSFPRQFKDWVDEQHRNGELGCMSNDELDVWKRAYTAPEELARLPMERCRRAKAELALYKALDRSLQLLGGLWKKVKGNFADISGAKRGVPNNCDELAVSLALLLQMKFSRQGYFSDSKQVWRATPHTPRALARNSPSEYWRDVQAKYAGEGSFTSDANHLVVTNGAGEEAAEAGSTEFVFAEEARVYLESLPGPFYVTVVSGPQRSGKSEMMNRMVRSMVGAIRGASMERRFFQTSANHESCTRGAWFIAFPHPSGVGTVLFIDSEGTGSSTRTATHDSFIVTLTYMLCQNQIYRGTNLNDTDPAEKLKQYLKIALDVETKLRQPEAAPVAGGTGHDAQRRHLLLVVKDSQQGDRDFAAAMQRGVLQSIFGSNSFDELGGHGVSEFHPANRNVHLHLGGAPLAPHSLSSFSGTPWHMLYKEYRAPMWRLFGNISRYALGLSPANPVRGDGAGAAEGAERLYGDEPEAGMNVGAPLRDLQGCVIFSGKQLTQYVSMVTKAVDKHGIRVPSINASLQDQKMKDGAQVLVEWFQLGFVDRLQGADERFPFINRDGWAQSMSGRGSVWTRGAAALDGQNEAAACSKPEGDVEDHALHDVSRLDRMKDYDFVTDQHVLVATPQPGEVRIACDTIDDRDLFAMYPIHDEELRRHFEQRLAEAKRRFHLTKADPDCVVDFVAPGAEGARLMKEVGEAKYLVQDGLERVYDALRDDNEAKARALARDVMADRFGAYVERLGYLWQFRNEDSLEDDAYTGLDRFHARVAKWKAKVLWLLDHRVSARIVDDELRAFEEDTVGAMARKTKLDIARAKAKYMEYVRNEDVMQMDTHPDFAIGMYACDAHGRWSLVGCSEVKAEFLLRALQQDMRAAGDGGGFPEQIVAKWRHAEKRNLDQLLNVAVARYLSHGYVLVLTYPRFSGLLPRRVVQRVNATLEAYLELVWEAACGTSSLHESLGAATEPSTENQAPDSCRDALVRLQEALVQRTRARNEQHPHACQVSQAMQLLVPVDEEEEEEDAASGSAAPKEALSHRQYRVDPGTAEWFRQHVAEQVQGEALPDDSSRLASMESPLPEPPGPITAAAVTGPLRSGKSFLTRLLVEKFVGRELLPASWQAQGGFNISSQTSSFTKGAWVVGIPNPNNNGWLLLIDCEGTGSLEGGRTQASADARLFSAVFAFATVFMYNKKVPINERSAYETMSLFLQIGEGLKAELQKVQQQGEAASAAGCGGDGMTCDKSLILIARDHQSAYRDADESYRRGILREALLGEKASTLADLTEEHSGAQQSNGAVEGDQVALPAAMKEALAGRVDEVSLFLINTPHAETQNCEMMKALPFTDLAQTFISPFRRLQREVTARLCSGTAHMQLLGSDICTGAQLMDLLSSITTQLNAAGTNLIPEMGDAAEMIQRNNLEKKRAELLGTLNTSLEHYSQGLAADAPGVQGFPMPAAQLEGAYADARQQVVSDFDAGVWKLNTREGRANFDATKHSILDECDKTFKTYLQLNETEGRRWAQEEVTAHWEREIVAASQQGQYTFGGGWERPESMALDPVGRNFSCPDEDLESIVNVRKPCPRLQRYHSAVEGLERKLRSEVLPHRCATAEIIDEVLAQNHEANVAPQAAQLEVLNDSLRKTWYQRRKGEMEARQAEARIEVQRKEMERNKELAAEEKQRLQADLDQTIQEAHANQVESQRKMDCAEKRSQAMQAELKQEMSSAEKRNREVQAKLEANVSKTKAKQRQANEELGQLNRKVTELRNRQPTVVKKKCWGWGLLCFEGSATVHVLRADAPDAVAAETIAVSQLHPRTHRVRLLDGRAVRVLAVTASLLGNRKFSRVRSTVSTDESCSITEDHPLVAQLACRVEPAGGVEAPSPATVVYDIVLDPHDLARGVDGAELPDGRFELSVSEVTRCGCSAGDQRLLQFAEAAATAGGAGGTSAAALVPIAFCVDGVFVKHSLPTEFAECPIASLVALNTATPLVVEAVQRARCAADTEGGDIVNDILRQAKGVCLCARWAVCRAWAAR